MEFLEEKKIDTGKEMEIRKKQKQGNKTKKKKMEEEDRCGGRRKRKQRTSLGDNWAIQASTCYSAVRLAVPWTSQGVSCQAEASG